VVPSFTKGIPLFTKGIPSFTKGIPVAPSSTKGFGAKYAGAWEGGSNAEEYGW
jgi:hypothetical protein